MKHQNNAMRRLLPAILALLAFAAIPARTATEKPSAG